jgi:hypothetical protein
MNFPPRLAHLATSKVVAAKLVPAFAKAHLIDEEEALERLERALPGSLLEQLLEATWRAMADSTKRFDETRLLEKIFATLKDRPYRPGRPVLAVSADLAAFYVLVDISAGTASDSARRLLETDAGRARGQAGLAEAGRYLAKELTRGNASAR